MKTKAQISFAETAKLISAIVFATQIVQSLLFLNLKFQAFSHLLCLYISVCAEPVQNLFVGFLMTRLINDGKFYSSHHNENLPMQNKEIFFRCKNGKFHWKNFDIFLIFAPNIDCGYMLEPPRRGGSNEYPQPMFWSKNKKNRYTPPYPRFAI